MKKRTKQENKGGCTKKKMIALCVNVFWVVFFVFSLKECFDVT
jgi:hypothetical protein